ncbi:unnamed protein product [Albugo candida]|uniref:Uncharacterized protein n=1 Tax=Albugo candida TaxID=65357 RepID=A0A024FZ36_9STRA|nr:unnamed protein product [Albugo candida]|eukprot:CCI39315.1 unnamed protein product [Albugo candida]
MSLSSLRKSSKMFGFSIQSITKSFWRKPYDTSKTSVKSEHFERYEKLRDQFMNASAALSIREIDSWSIAMWLLYYPVRYLDFVMSSHHRFLDRMTARLTQHRVFFPHGFFGDGWGDVTVSERIRKIAESDEMKRVHTIKNGIQWISVKAFPNLKVKLQEGSFRTTLEDDSVLPECSQTAYFELVTPLEMKKEKNFDTLVISLPGTGEHGYGHRRNTLAIPLALHGVSTLILEGPFYGKRKPPNQIGSKLRRVSDLPLLGQTTITEAKSLLYHFKEHHSYTRFVVAGSSMGGLHAAMTASTYPFDVGVVAWLAPLSGASAFAEGVLSNSCNWSALYNENIDLQDAISNRKDAIPFSAPSTEHMIKVHGDKESAKQRLVQLLSFTDITNFAPPKRPEATVFVYGTEDTYVGSSEAQRRKLQEKWQPMQIRCMKRGHVSGILLEQEVFQQTILQILQIL